MNERSAARQMDDAVEAARSVVRDSAASVSDAAGKAAGAGAALAEEASERLSETVDYVRGTNPEDVWNGVVDFVKSKPMQSMAAAVALGFMLGRAARRS